MDFSYLDNTVGFCKSSHISIIVSLLNTVIIVKFHNERYAVNEDIGIIQPLLVLSNSSSFNETVQVINTDISTNGK